MSQKNSDKNKYVLKELEKTISPVLVVNNSSLKPYVELFEYAPENIYQQPLGSLVGFFEIKEFSDESAYIVNHLTAVLKKEYYINPKRPVTESLDSALHKVNMALSEIARIGNVEWLGKLNAAICVLEKNNAHFSVSGNARIFLYRKQTLSEISEDLASDSSDPHPLKTFINVSSGRLEKNDRLLITSGDIFHILSSAEIKKNFERLEGEKFVQFLKTALSNQIEMIASVVVEMSEVAPAESKKALTRKKASVGTTNVFSEKTFANSSSAQTLTEDYPLEEISEKIEDANYTDKKTGHIYIQGQADENDANSNSQLNLYQDLIKEKITQGIFLTKNELRKRFSLYKKQLAKKRALRMIEKEKRQQLEAEDAKRLEEQRVLEEIENEQRMLEEKELEKIRLEEEKILAQELSAKIALEEEEFKKNSPQEMIPSSPTEEAVLEIKETRELSFKEKLARVKLEQNRSAVIDLRKKETPIIDIYEEKNADEEEVIIHTAKNISIEKTSPLQKVKSFTVNVVEKISPALQTAKKYVIRIIKKIQSRKSSDSASSSMLSLLPHFSIIKRLFARFSTKQKLYTLLALAVVFIAPLFIVKFLNRPKPPTIANIEVIPISQIKILANEKNIDFNTQINKLLSNSGIINSLIANENPTLITSKSIIVLKDGQPKEFQLPSGSGSPIQTAYMNDLSLILVLTDAGKIISFSPISEKFSENNITLNNISSTSFIGTYLTYLYLIDQKTNQIYRFPRADGGFGAQASWLKDSTSLSGTSDMTIDDNIYIVQSNQVLKFFKGKKVDFSLEASSTPVNFDKIYTTPDLNSFYALDVKNSRLVQFSKDGTITAQYFNEALKDATSFSVDEKNKLAFIATSEGLLSMQIR